jgi:hypothetical protein
LLELFPRNIFLISQLDAQELELDDTLEKMNKDFQVLFEAQLEKSELSRISKQQKSEENYGAKKSSLKKWKSEDKLDANKSVR